MAPMSKQRYDEKRKTCPERRLKERARQHIRHVSRLGFCSAEGCSYVGPMTVKHHDDYAKPAEFRELCYTCHRKCHPRKMPHGVVV